MSDYAAVHGFVSGRVQGVGFRYFTQEIAVRYDLKGWVKNLPDGRVEFGAEGSEGLLKEFLKDINRGPRTGYVSDLKVDWSKYKGKYESFELRF